MNNRKFGMSATLVAVLVVSGCATSTQNYTPPKVTSIVNSKHVSQPFDATWDNLVRQLSSDFFVINNIDKNSRLINISFSSQKPSDFVDCGSSVRTFKNARGEQRYEYLSADSSTYPIVFNNGIGANIRRTTKLEGRTNIYAAPEGSGTIVTVNTKYVVNLQMNSTSFDGSATRSENFTWDFSTKQGQSGEVQCYANGAIERRILSLIED